MKRKRIVIGVSIALMSLALTACPERIRISDINRDPGRFYDKEVTVAGKVVRSYGAVQAGGFEIDDGTGKLLVATEKYGGASKDPDNRVAWRGTSRPPLGGPHNRRRNDEK